MRRMRTVVGLACGILVVIGMFTLIQEWMPGKQGDHGHQSGPDSPNSRAVQAQGDSEAGRRIKTEQWNAIRKSVLTSPSDVEFAVGLGGLFSSQDPDIRAWAREHLATWAPVVRLIKGLDREDPLDRPEGDPEWERLKELAIQLGLENEVVQYPRGGPGLAAAMRRKTDVNNWASGIGRCGETVEVPLNAFSPGLKLRLRFGNVKTIGDGWIGNARLPVDTLAVVGSLINGSGTSVATLENAQLGLPGELASHCSVSGQGKESIHLWLRWSGGELIHWWVRPIRLPKDSE